MRKRRTLPWRRAGTVVPSSGCTVPTSLEEASGRRETPEMTLDFEEAIGRLPDGARQVFILHDVAGYRHEEIAELLGVAPGTSKSQLHHARMALRRHLQ